MSRKTRHADNSKRQQPTQQRAQARQASSPGPVKSDRGNKRGGGDAQGQSAGHEEQRR